MSDPILESLQKASQAAQNVIDRLKAQTKEAEEKIALEKKIQDYLSGGLTPGQANFAARLVLPK